MNPTSRFFTTVFLCCFLTTIIVQANCPCEISAGKGFEVAKFGRSRGYTVKGAFSPNSGNFIAAWDSPYVPGSGAQLFGRAGNPKGKQILLDKGFTVLGGVTYNPDRGEFLIIWARSWQAPNGQIVAQIVTDTGIPVGSPIIIESESEPYRIFSLGEPVYDPNGKFYVIPSVVWKVATPPAQTTFAVYLQRLDANGNLIGVKERINTNVKAGAADIHLIRNDYSKKYLAVWFSGIGVQYQFFNEMLNKIGSNKILASSAEDANYLRASAVPDSASFAAFWNEPAAGLKARRIDANGHLSPVKVIALEKTLAVQSGDVESDPSTGGFLLAFFGSPPDVVRISPDLTFNGKFTVACIAQPGGGG